MKMTGNNHDRFWVFIDDRRLPSFKPRPGLHRRPVFGTIGCSFDCRCKGTKFRRRNQVFIEIRWRKWCKRLIYRYVAIGDICTFRFHQHFPFVLKVGRSFLRLLGHFGSKSFRVIFIFGAQSHS